jgi:hypothetical protein
MTSRRGGVEKIWYTGGVVNDLAATDAAALVDPGATPRSVSGEPRWRFGSALEFLAVGGGTLLLLPLCWWYRRAFGLSEGELLMGMLAFHAASLINDPHFAATYLLFYRDVKARALGTVYVPKQRARYWVAGVLVPLTLVGWSVLAIANHSAPALGVLIQLAFLLVGWHYVKQGFGVLSVLSARRGISWSRAERRVLLGHCFAGWAYAWASPFDPGSRAVVNGVFYVTLPQPPGLELACFVAFLASGFAALAVVARKWRRERGRGEPGTNLGHEVLVGETRSPRRLLPNTEAPNVDEVPNAECPIGPGSTRPSPAQRGRGEPGTNLGHEVLVPLAGLLITVWLWTVYTRLDPLLMYWIPALHSLQYLYFVGLLRRNSALTAAGPPSFKGNASRELAVLGVSVVGLGWLLLRGAPAWIDAALVLPATAASGKLPAIGPTPWLAAFTAVVNIHHYFMDSVIWRREHAETRHLLGGCLHAQESVRVAEE